MSTLRAGLRETTASTRPAARWQRESASDPITRVRWAKPTRPAACSATRSVRVASSERISMRSFGPGPSSGTPFRNAPPPRRATHSSPLPKSWTKPSSTSSIRGPEATASESEKNGMPRLAFRLPSIGSQTTVTPSPPSPKTRRPELLRDQREAERNGLEHLDHRGLRRGVHRGRLVAPLAVAHPRLPLEPRRQLPERAPTARAASRQTSSQSSAVIRRRGRRGGRSSASGRSRCSSEACARPRARTPPPAAPSAGAR